MANDGKIRKSDLLESGAENVYDQLSQKATKAIKEITLALDKLDKEQKKLGLSTKDIISIEKQRSIETKKAEKAIKAKEVAEAKSAKAAIARVNKESATRQALARQQHKEQTNKIRSEQQLALIAKKKEIALQKEIALTKRATVSTKQATAANINLGKSIKQAFSRFLGFTVISTAIFGFVSALRNAIQRVIDFDKTMTNLSGVLQTTRKELSGLELDIINVASNSIKTSNEVAALAIALATLGKTKSEISDLLEPVNNLSIGLESTSEEAGNLLVNTLNAFGKGTDEAIRFADIIAKMRITTSLDFEKIKDSLGFLAPTARAAGVSLEQTGAILGVLVSNGIKASRAGRLMSSSFLRLSTDGLTFNDALDQINKAQENNVSSTDLLALSSKLLGQRSGALGLILSENRKKVEDLTKEFKNADGTLKELTDKQLKSLSAQMRILDSTWEKFILNIEKGDGALANFSKRVIVGTGKIINLLDAVSNNSEGFFDFFDKLGQVSVSPSMMASILMQEEARKINVKNKSLVEDLIKLTKERNDINKQATNIDALRLSFSKLNTDQLKEVIRVFELKIRKEKELEEARLKAEAAARAKLLLDKKSLKNLKQFANLENQIQAQRIQAEIDANNRIIQADGTLYSEKINLLNENYYSEGIIIALQTKDKIDSIELLRKKDLDAGENKAKTNKYYDDLIKLEKGKHTKEILDLQFKLTQGLDKLAEDEVKNTEKTLNDELTLIKSKLKNELKANKDAFDRGDLNRKQLKEANKKLYDDAEKDAIKLIDNVFSTIRQLMIAAGLPVEALDAQIAKLKDSFIHLGDGIDTAAEHTKRLTTIYETVGKAINKIGEISKNNSDARISQIEAEITAEQEKYARLQELAGDDVLQKKQLDVELAAHIKVLKEKERKEKEKQWKIDQKVALAEAAINIAVAITNSAKKGFWNIFPMIALGALELGVIAAQKMPKFAKGGIMGYDGQALINDGGKKEFIERNGSIFSTDNKNAVVNLQKGDIIHKDLDALLNANIMHSIATDNKLDVSGLKNIMSENYSNLEGALTRVLKNNKSTVNLRTQKIDIPQALYKQSKLKW